MSDGLPGRLNLLAFRRTGGFAGLPEPSLRSPDLAPDELADVARLVRAVGDAPATGGPDLLRYELDVEVDGTRRRVVFSERAVPADLQPLLGRLTRMARASR